MRCILYGNLDYSVAMSFAKQFPLAKRTKQSFQQHTTKGLLILISDHLKSPLVAQSAMLLLNKMLDFQKNIYADHVLRELQNLEPDFLTLFGIESLLQMECSKQATA